jgi:protein-S-isoprenylcysteine O-methyltransferase Ste14
MAFGLRFSNLTNRGIIARGPYAWIRHPAYVSKNIAWWAENARSFSSLWQIIFLAAWNYIYYLRAVTEERHLLRDPDYRAYCQKAPYRFIPGFF